MYICITIIIIMIIIIIISIIIIIIICYLTNILLSVVQDGRGTLYRYGPYLSGVRSVSIISIVEF